MPVVLGQHIDQSFHALDHRFETVAMPTHPSAQRLIAYWQNCQAKGGMRLGRDLPARPIAALLGNVIVYEPIGDWDDARIRYAGFGMAKYFGRDVNGLLFSEISAGNRDGSLKQLFSEARDLVREKQPRVRNHILMNEGIELARHQLVMLPILGPEGDRSWILNAAFDL